ncbi:MFS general substrate transporter [Panus rudis PR-1116 ss-1]|nr:MFS general substrate transporter [Panus rudis PR-1116 ss-1]
MDRQRPEFINLSPVQTIEHAYPPTPNTELSQEPFNDANVQELPPMDTGRKAWGFCISAFILESLVWGFGFSYGIFQTYYTSHPPFDKVARVGIAAVGPTALAITYGEGILLSFFYGRYPDLIKKSMWAGLTLSVLCLFLSSFVNKVWLLILFQGVGLGVAGGVLYWPVILFLSEWFLRKRGLASGIVFAGGGVGGFLFPLFVGEILDNVGHRWTLRILALMQAILGGLALFGVNPRIPPPKFSRGQDRPQFIPARMQFFKRIHFWTFAGTNLLQAMSYFPVSLYIAAFATSIASPLSASIVLSLFNVAGVVGYILTGYLSDLFPYPWIMFASTLGSAISAFLLWGFADTLARVFAFAIIFGLLAGGFPSVLFAAATDSANPNPEQAPMAVSAFTSIKGLAAILGPIVSGVLLDAGKSVTNGPYGKFGFGPVELFVGSCALASTLSSIAVAATRPRLLTTQLTVT